MALRTALFNRFKGVIPVCFRSMAVGNLPNFIHHSIQFEILPSLINFGLFVHIFLICFLDPGDFFLTGFKKHPFSSLVLPLELSLYKMIKRTFGLKELQMQSRNFKLRFKFLCNFIVRIFHPLRILNNIIFNQQFLQKHFLNIFCVLFQNMNLLK